MKIEAHGLIARNMKVFYSNMNARTDEEEKNHKIKRRGSNEGKVLKCCGKKQCTCSELSPPAHRAASLLVD